MKTIKEELGKVSVTTNGLWDSHKTYDRLCLVHDGHFASFISKRAVPANIPLSDITYWQPLSSLRDDIKIDYKEFKEYILNTVDKIVEFVNTLVPEINWDILKNEILTVVETMVKDGDFKLGITSVDFLSQAVGESFEKDGNLIYVNTEERYYTYYKGVWRQMPIIYVGDEQPIGDVLWINPNTNDVNAEKDEELFAIKEAIKDLQSVYPKLERFITFGVIPGDSGDGTRRLIMAQADPIRPEDASDEIQDTEDEENPDDVNKPDTSFAEKTVACVCCKLGTAADFNTTTQDYVDGELVFYTDRKKFAVYYRGDFYVISGGGGTSSGGSGGAGITEDELINLSLSYLTFAGDDYKYKTFIDSDGKWKVFSFKSQETPVGQPVKNNVYVSHLLCINSIFCGGEGSEECQCTHNFVELANGSTKDINLNGLYLLYSDGTKASSGDVGYNWKVLALNGIIKAGSTFVIRGAECNTPKRALINVEGYDLEWKIGKELIKFNQGCSSFYLCVGTGFQELLDNKLLNNPWIAETRVGYIDSCGFGTGSVGEGTATFNVPDDWNKVLFIRWFTLDPSKQANKAYSARKTTALMSYINLDKQTEKLGNSTQYYYSDKIKVSFRPKSSEYGKTFFDNKTHFNKDKPNYINCLFGIQATDSGFGATRCFNWVSVGNYDEFVEIRKKDTTDWVRYYSITRNNRNNTSAINKFIDHYARFRWCASDGTWVTTHKCIVKQLSRGTYEYRVGRDNNNLYYSDILEFNVESNAEVTNFSFIQTSDQQGFNWAEYTAWWKTADVISEKEKNFNFMINTGDITQSGNRVSEWLDYYSGKQKLINKCEMFTIGNNDLCGHDATKLTDGEDATSKYSHINVLRYFCFELDERNEYSFQWGENGIYPIYSLYSFNYGKYHFISLNSEIAIATSKMYKDWESDNYGGDRTFAEQANAHIESWLKKDLQLWKNNDNEPADCSKAIVFMHEMPFTIVTYDFMKGKSARVGSHLNTLNANGLYRYSRLFKKYGIRVVIGGHKHTYCITKPIYDAPDGYVNSLGQVQPNIDLMATFDSTNDDGLPVKDGNAAAISRIPVIQVKSNAHIQETEFARYEVVNKFNAPTFIMSQASGYKLVSNKEMPSGPEYRIPWLLTYFAAATSASSPKENAAQHKPMYIRYDCSDNAIVVTANQVENIWDVNISKNSSNFDFNNQLTELSSTKMTLTETTDSDKEAYNITNIENLTIEL